MPPVTRALFAAALLLASLPARAQAPAAPRPSLEGAGRWACFYGGNLSEEAWRALDLAITDPDHFVLPSSSGPLRLAYVSAGEADERRSFWPEVRDKPFLIEPNPDWPGAHRADLRDPAWRGVLLSTVVPSALAKGYDGVMLDTLDVAEYLESSAPARFAGSRDAALGFVLELRRRRPGALIVVNNALPLLERLGDAVDGVLVEDLYTRCLPSSERCEATPETVSAAKERTLRAFRKRTGRPVFVILYAWPGERDSALVRRAVERTRAAGFLPYVASPTLERLGRVAPGAGP